MKPIRSGSWYPSRWGPDDEIGALNLVTPELVRRAAGRVKTGKVYNLAHVLEPGIPVHWVNGAFHYSTFRSHSDTGKLTKSKNGFAAMSVRLEIGDHTGTHIDGLNHISKDLKLYNGVDAVEATGQFGTSRNGIESTPPIFTRGVLADVARFVGEKHLPKGHVISEGELRGCLEKSKISIEQGDALLIATGWSQLWMKDNQGYLGDCPGIGVGAAEWIVERGASVVGSDTWKVEVHPGEKVGVITPVHQIMITQNGIRLLENLNLEELRKDRATEFLFVCLPLMVKGGAGSPVTPVAVS